MSVIGDGIYFYSKLVISDISTIKKPNISGYFPSSNDVFWDRRDAERFSNERVNLEASSAYHKRVWHVQGRISHVIGIDCKIAHF